jgi:hypothetical protein
VTMYLGLVDKWHDNFPHIHNAHSTENANKYHSEIVQRGDAKGRA